MMEKNKVEIKKMKQHLKEPLSSPGGEGAGQKRNGSNGTASMPGVLDLLHLFPRVTLDGPLPVEIHGWATTVGMEVEVKTKSRFRSTREKMIAMG